jgi:cytochrome c biogenesis protein
MLVFLLGIIVSALARFDAEMVLAEGQTLALAEDRMLRINGKGRLSPALPGTLLTLSKFESRFEQDKYPVDFAAHLKLADGSEAAQEKTVRVNQPLRYGKWQIFLHRYGFAPRFELLDKDSRLLFDAFVNLIISRPEQEDYIDIPSQRLRIETRFFPDYRKDGEKAVSLSGIPKNPVMLIRALEDGESIGERYVPLGETAQFGEYRLTFAELRYWAWFGVVHDPGYGFIIVGFVLCVAGLVVRFVVSERWLRVMVEEKNGAASVTLSGRSRYFPAFFEKELESIRRQLQTRVDSATIGMERGEKE